ncbi:hypothetical protein BDV93DRAFT_518846 [Ceratobasidium sp. AG-I]|nr:hypothetical protein BDV93DRAFT_518846 [Ceratobasidium sp. AG-I]
MKFQAAAGGAAAVLQTIQALAWRDEASRAVTVLLAAKLCLSVMYRSSSDPVAAFSPLTQLLSIELVKIAFSFAWWMHERKTVLPGDQYIRLENGHDEVVSSPRPEAREEGQDASTSLPLRFSIPPYPVLVPLCGIAALSCAVGFSGIEAQRFATPGAVHIFSLFTPFVCGALLRLLSRRQISASVWNSMLFQLAGLALVQCGAGVSSIRTSSIAILVGRVYLQAVLLNWIDHAYKAVNYPLSLLNIVVWGTSSVIYLAAYLFYNINSLASLTLSPFALVFIFISAIEATALISVLKYCDAIVAGVASYSVSCFVAILSVFAGTMNHELVVVLGLGIAIYGLVMFVMDRVFRPEESIQEEQDVQLEERPFRALIALAIVGFVSVVLTVAVSSQVTGVGLQSPRPTAWFDFASLPPSQTKAWCPRKPLAKLSGRKETRRTVSAFDNVLLIVFFSHPRYDTNLQYHLDMYGDYFPNIVYVGPQTREDAGHKGVYDVLVDGFKSDEDLNGDWFKMAGRMAHHMLYTAMKENPCYDGYLWAPFDTFLNVPRLMQFKQDTIWWHSPFTNIINYVENPANKNASHHAPPGNIQPGPAKNLIADFKHWGPDWWWGEPHVGLQVCMPAFEKVPAARRSTLRQLTGGELRMIGGSADTLYLPGYLRESFLETLDPFLDTDCFLEIAVPTAVHLARPASQKITFIDHWWIWEEPLNATFVRNQWNNGYEVDTFHKYQFGAKDENGHFRGNPAHIIAVQDLLAESFRRQGMA